MDDVLAAQMIRFWADPAFEIDWEKGRKVFADYVLGRDIITRREVILAAYYAYAVGIKRDVQRIKYILILDYKYHYNFFKKI